MVQITGQTGLLVAGVLVGSMAVVAVPSALNTIDSLTASLGNVAAPKCLELKGGDVHMSGVFGRTAQTRPANDIEAVNLVEDRVVFNDGKFCAVIPEQMQSDLIGSKGARLFSHVHFQVFTVYNSYNH